MTVLYAKPDDKQKRVRICIDCDGDESTVFNISFSTYTSLGSPTRGNIISEKNFSDIKFEDETYRALKKAVTYLTAADKSRYELKAKLISQGFSRDACDVAIEKCVSYGYLDEASQVERLVEREANYKLRGRYHIKRKLMAKGYSSSDVDHAIARLVECGEIDFDANFESLAQKRGVESDEERFALKYKFGYKI